MEKIKTITEVRRSFWDMLRQFNPILAAEYRTGKRQNAYITDIRVLFVDYVDQLHRSGEISDKLAQKVTL